MKQANIVWVENKFQENLKSLKRKIAGEKNRHLQISCLMTSRQQHTKEKTHTHTNIMKQAEHKTQNN